MNTKIIYVLSSNKEDFFTEQCLVSILSVKYHVKNPYIVLVNDAKTHESLSGLRAEILSLVDEVITIDFEENVTQLERSRLMKVNLRKYIKGDYLYVDCDTLICSDLSEIDASHHSIMAALDGHCNLKSHPMKLYFEKQNKHLNYDFSVVTKYYSGGVIYAKDDTISHDFYEKWASNYSISVLNNVFIDEPALSKTNVELDYVISELSGIWNCQIRFGALFLSDAKILHFCGKRNMPLHKLATKDFLTLIKRTGTKTPDLHFYIKNWKNGFDTPLISFGIDKTFSLSNQYEITRKEFYQNTIKESIFQKHINSISDLYKSCRNNILGRLCPHYLSELLYKETFWKKTTPIQDINQHIHYFAFHADCKKWSDLADKLYARKFVESKGIPEILPVLYGKWDVEKAINFEELPCRFVLKCNHDNASSIIISDKYSIDKKFILSFYKKRLNKRYGIDTAEPHYKNIRPYVFAEEYIENDKIFSDSLVNYKFFSYNGNCEYCQVVYDCQNYKNHKVEVYKVDGWQFCKGYVIKNEGMGIVPKPNSLDEMIRIVHVLTADLDFCRLDLYEYHNRVYFSEFTFMPGCGRISSFSQEFLNILGLRIK